MLVNPDLGTGWQVGFFALIVLSIAVEIATYMRGVWTRPMLALTAVESALWIGYIVALAMSEPIINPELARRFGGESGWWKTGGQANSFIAIVIVAITIWELWEAWRGHREYRMANGQMTVAGVPHDA